MSAPRPSLRSPGFRLRDNPLFLREAGLLGYGGRARWRNPLWRTAALVVFFVVLYPLLSWCAGRAFWWNKDEVYLVFWGGLILLMIFWPAWLMNRRLTAIIRTRLLEDLAVTLLGPPDLLKACIASVFARVLPVFFAMFPSLVLIAVLNEHISSGDWDALLTFIGVVALVIFPALVVNTFLSLWITLRSYRTGLALFLVPPVTLIVDVFLIFTIGVNFGYTQSDVDWHSLVPFVGAFAAWAVLTLLALGRACLDGNYVEDLTGRTHHPYGGRSWWRSSLLVHLWLDGLQGGGWKRALMWLAAGGAVGLAANVLYGMVWFRHDPRDFPAIPLAELTAGLVWLIPLMQHFWGRVRPALAPSCDLRAAASAAPEQKAPDQPGSDRAALAANPEQPSHESAGRAQSSSIYPMPFVLSVLMPVVLLVLLAALLTYQLFVYLKPISVSVAMMEETALWMLNFMFQAMFAVMLSFFLGERLWESGRPLSRLWGWMAGALVAVEGAIVLGSEALRAICWLDLDAYHRNRLDMACEFHYLCVVVMLPLIGLMFWDAVRRLRRSGLVSAAGVADRTS
ncbi:MAG: hypothetical protein Kow0059_06620 [Candidatus Sumerlaeia bacterium]